MMNQFLMSFNGTSISLLPKTPHAAMRNHTPNQRSNTTIKLA